MGSTIGIQYDPSKTFSYENETYSYAATLTFTNYKLDKYGRRIDNSGNKNLKVRAFYTIEGMDNLDHHMPLSVEDILTYMTVKRANSVEKEITPLATIIDRRNTRIDDLGNLLASVAKTQSQLESQEEGDDASKDCKGLCYYLYQYFSEEELSQANLLDFVKKHKTKDDACSSKRSDGYIASANQLLKAKIDTLNNDASSDLQRMDNLVNKRDEAFTLATDLLGKLTDGRSTILNNMN